MGEEGGGLPLPLQLLGRGGASTRREGVEDPTVLDRHLPLSPLLPCRPPFIGKKLHSDPTVRKKASLEKAPPPASLPRAGLRHKQTAMWFGGS